MGIIIPAAIADAPLLTKIARESFIESHGSSAPDADINSYINKHYSTDVFEQELSNTKNNYSLIYQDDIIAGYSNIITDVICPGIKQQPLAKLDRIYLLQSFYNSGLGYQLFHYNVALAKASAQKGIWLYVWTANQRALRFYTRNGFTITGHHDFKISDTHSNPNYRMLLQWD